MVWGAPEVDIFEIQPGGEKFNSGSFLESTVGQPFMLALYQVYSGITHNLPGQGTWMVPGQCYYGVEDGNMTALNIYFYGNYNHYKGDTREEKNYWYDAKEIIDSLIKVTFEGNIITDWSGT